MSCQTQPAATRAFTDTDKHATVNVHRSVRFSSESRGSVRNNHDNEKRDTSSGAISLTSLAVTPLTSHVMSQSAPSNFDMMSTSPQTPQSCRFPKLEECAHFHYERVSLGTLSIELVPGENTQDDQAEGWVYLKVRSHVNAAPDTSQAKAISASWTDTDSVSEWTLSRSADNFIRLDDLLHRCIYDRKVSGLPNLTDRLTPSLILDTWQYQRLIADYVHHLSIIADDSINCGPVLNWLQCDNKGHRLLVSREDSSSINTPAVAAAYCVRRYAARARDEISFDVGDMISIIDMPGPQESVWWRGKRGFRVGFFPQQCVSVIGDKVPRHMTTPPPIVGSVALAPIKPVLRKHGKLISLFRSFILSRPSRRSLKQQGILKERVFGCDLGEHLLNCGHDVPVVVSSCCAAIEQRGAVDGIYRLSGGAGLTHRLRAAFDAGARPDLAHADLAADPHAVPSLLKMYFRELPNPLCTYQLYDALVAAVQQPEDRRLRAVKHTLFKLPPPHYRTLSYLMRHLRRVSLLHAETGMTSRNMAIVWAPNLLRASHAQHALQGVAVQAVITEFLICYAEELFSEDQASDTSSEIIDTEEWEQVELRGTESTRRPKSLPIHQTSKLLSLEEARRRGGLQPPRAPQSTVATTHTANTQNVCLRPTAHLTPNYIEVGSGPNNLPQYHTVLELPAAGCKRGLKRSPSGWRGLFSRSKLRAPPAPPVPPLAPAAPATTATPAQDVCMTSSLRPVKSCESVTSLSDNNQDVPLDAQPLKHHTRSSSCDSYFESWQAELASMRLRLAPQERTTDMFTEEQNEDSSCSEPGDSNCCSIEPSPRKNLRVDIEAANELITKRSTIEEQLSSIGYIDVESPRARNLTEKRSCRPASPNDDLPKRLCTDRDSPLTAAADFQASLGAVKMRERNSPRKTKCASRYSGVHQPLTLTDDRSTVTAVNSNVKSRLTWHGKDGHSTLIKIDWPIENSSVSNLTTSTLNSSPLTPVTPVYDVLDSDSEVSEANKHTIEIKSENCDNCDEEKCLKCELKATDYGNLKVEDFTEQNINDSPEHSILNSTDISYQNLNRLSAVSTSSNSEPNSDRKKDHNYENCETKLSVMSSSHESSSSYSNVSPIKQTDELFDCHTAKRPSYINLQSSSTSKSSPGTPLKSPLKSTISITFRSPTKSKSPDYEIMDNMNTPTNDRDYNVYEDLNLEKNLSIVEEAPVPETDASLPTQQACQPQDFTQDLIILETPTENCNNDADLYSQVKFFKKSIDEVNAMILESPNKEIHYENVNFGDGHASNHYNEDTLQICDKDIEISENHDDKVCEAVNIGLPSQIESIEKDNGNIVKAKVVQTNLNVRELANIFESPTELKAPFTFDKFKTEVKYSTLERKDEDKKANEIKKQEGKAASPKYNLSKNSCTARSLDENAFVKEFGSEKSDTDRRKSLEVKDVKRTTKFLPDLNLNLEENDAVETKIDITPTTENKISLIQRFNDTKTPDIKTIIGTDTDNLSRERIEKYKEERRNFLREKYSSQSFRSNPEHLTRIKLKKDDDKSDLEQTKAFERRNTVDLGQRMRFSLARSANNLDSIHSPQSPDSPLCPKPFEVNIDGQQDPSREDNLIQYNIRDVTAMFEQKSLNNTG